MNLRTGILGRIKNIEEEGAFQRSMVMAFGENMPEVRLHTEEGGITPDLVNNQKQSNGIYDFLLLL